MEEKKPKNKTENKKTNKEENKILAVIRIHGMVKIRSEIAESLSRLRLRRKYSCILINSNNKSLMGILEKVKFFVAFGEIDKEVLVKLLKERGQLIEKEKNKKADFEKVVEEIIKGKKLRDLGLKPFFRLHPPRKGIKSKLQYPKGVLGNNGKDINKLIERML